MAIAGSLIVNLEARTAQLENELKKARFLIRQMQAQIRDIGGQTSTTERQVVQGFQRINNSVAAFESVGRRAALALNAFVAAAAALGGLSLIQRTIEFGDALGDVADNLNISVEALQTFRFAAEQSGSSSEELDRALGALNNRIGEAASGSQEAQQQFANLGLRWQELQRVGIEESFLVIADAVRRLENQSDRTARAQDVLGKTSRSLITLLSLGSEGIRAFEDRLRAMGALLEGETVKRLGDANNAINTMRTVLQSRLAIAIADLTPRILDFAASFERVARALTDAQSSTAGLTQRERDIVDFLTKIRDLAQAAAKAFGDIAVAIGKIPRLPELPGGGVPGSFAPEQQRRFALLAQQEILRNLQQELTYQQSLLDNARGLTDEVARRDVILKAIAETEKDIADTEATILEIHAQGPFVGPPPPPPPVLLPPVEVRGERERPPLVDPFKIDRSAEDLAKRLKELEKSFAESERQLEGWAAVLRSLGQPVEQTTEYINLLTTAIQARLALGVPVASQAIQELTLRLKALQDQAADRAFREEGLAGLTAFAERGPEIEPIRKDVDAQLQQLKTTIQVFGPSVDDAAQRVAILRQGLERAVAEGVLPFDAGLQKLRREFLAAEEAERVARRIAGGFVDLARGAEIAEEQVKQLADSLNEQFRTPAEQLRITRAQLATAADRLEPEAARQALQEAEVAYARTTLAGQGLVIVAEGIGDAFDQSFQGIIQGTITVGEAFRNLAQSILLSVSKILFQRGVEALLNVALSALAGGAGAGALGGAGGLGAASAPATTGVIPAGGALFQQGGPVTGPRRRGDRIPALLEAGEFILQRSAVDVIGRETLRRFNAVRSQQDIPPLRALLGFQQRFQQGGPVMPQVAGLAPMQAQGPALTINNIVVRDQNEADTRRRELESLDGHIVNVINKQILGGDGSLINRSLSMVRGGR